MAAAAVEAPPGDPGPSLSYGGQDDKATGEDTKDQKSKKKFKPLEKMRRFFKGSSKKKTKDSSVKAQSTGALYKDGGASEDDDDGGFRQSRLPMGGSRSISEDSVFKPEQKETANRESLRPAVSMEVGVNQFQRELFGRIKSRKISISEDEDDGLPRSPTPDASELVMVGGMKALPSQGKSSSRESDKSLISVDGSENEDDLFKSNWQKSVVSIKTANTRSKSDSSLEPSDMDLGVVKRDTQTLSSEAAKHRISVKPKARRSSSMHHRTRPSRERTTATPPLPSLNEESPTKSSPPPLTTSNKTSIQVKALSDDQVGGVTSPARVASKPVEAALSPQKPTEPVAKITLEKKPSLEDKATVESVPSKKIEDAKPVILKEKELASVQVSVGSAKTEEAKIRKDRPKSLMGGMPSQENVSKSGDSEFAQAFSKFKRLSLKKEVDVPTEVGTFNKSEKIEPLKEINVNQQADTSAGFVSPVKNNEGRIIGKLPLPAKETGNVSPTKDSDKASAAPTSSPKSSPSSSSSNVTYVLKKEPLRTSPASKSPSDYENIPYLQRQKSAESTAGSKPLTDYENIPYLMSKQKSDESMSSKSPATPVSPISSVSSPEHDYDNMPSLEIQTKGDNGKSEKLEDTNVTTISVSKDLSTNKLASPREEYRLKRQSRSKTLPEQPVSVEMLDPKSRPSALGKSFTTSRTETYKVTDSPNKSNFSRSFTAGKVDVNIVGEKEEAKKDSGVSPGSKRTEPKRLSWVGSSSHSTSVGASEPSWISMARKKHEVQEEKGQSAERKPSDSGSNTKASDKTSDDKTQSVSAKSDKPVAKPWEKPSPTVSRFGLGKDSEKPSVSVSKFGHASDSDKSGVSRFGQASKPASISSAKAEKEPVNPAQETKAVESTQKPPLKDKPAETQAKTSTLERKSMFEKHKTSTPQSSSVPAWKQSLIKKGQTGGVSSEPKIEIIEKDQPKSTPKVEEKKPVTQLRNTKGVTEKCADEMKSNRKSAVLDMVKNFQNMQVS